MPTPTPAVGAVMVRDGALFLVQRGTPPYAGQWTLPGGRVEPGERLADAVRREVAEETGLEVRVGALAGVVEVILPEVHYIILDYYAEPIGGVPAAGDDAAAVAWVPLAELAARPITPGLLGWLRAWGVVAS